MRLNSFALFAASYTTSCPPMFPFEPMSVVTEIRPGSKVFVWQTQLWSLSMACHVCSRELCAVEYESALDDLCGLLFLLCLSCWGLPLDPAECSHGEHATTAPGPWQFGHLAIPFTVPVNALSQQSLWNKRLQSKCTTEALWTNSCRHKEHV